MNESMNINSMKLYKLTLLLGCKEADLDVNAKKT
jgi:hypothetical protein